jgi:hypothetical protein
MRRVSFRWSPGHGMQDRSIWRPGLAGKAEIAERLAAELTDAARLIRDGQ